MSHFDSDVLVFPRCRDSFCVCVFCFYAHSVGGCWPVLREVLGDGCKCQAHAPSVESFAPVCYLCNPLRVGTETAVLISHHISLAVLVN